MNTRKSGHTVTYEVTNLMYFLLCGFGSAHPDMKQHTTVRTKPVAAPILNGRPIIVLFLFLGERIGICSDWQVHCA